MSGIICPSMQYLLRDDLIIDIIRPTINLVLKVYIIIMNARNK